MMFHSRLIKKRSGDLAGQQVDTLYNIATGQFYVEEEVKIILERVISDRKEQERSEQKEREERSKREGKEKEELMARRISSQAPKKDWVAYLLAVLPAEFSNMPAREPTERANNYDFVKDLILKRYRLNSEELKQYFSEIKNQQRSLGGIMLISRIVILQNG
ncbi:uncharacterized protein TNCV_1018191 [Trichonephila clavipes]|nr:uncharacterized protein TNCV_1018191 [Trichonephila clavipes]